MLESFEKKLIQKQKTLNESEIFDRVGEEKEEKFITAGQIAKKLKDWSHKFILSEANNLVSAGLLKFKRVGRENIFPPPNFSNEKINMEEMKKKIKSGNEKIRAGEKEVQEKK